MPPIVRELNEQHHIDESRHVSFGREIVKQLFDAIGGKDCPAEQLARIEKNVIGMFSHFIGLMYNPRVY